MIEKYDLWFKELKDFINANSEYNTRVVKYNTNTSTHFPIVSFVMSNYINTKDCTLDKIEYYDNLYFTIDIYTKDIIKNGTTISSQIVNEELMKLIIEFFNKKNMLRTSCRPNFNIDESILRTTIQYQCGIGSARGNIIRR